MEYKLDVTMSRLRCLSDQVNELAHRLSDTTEAKGDAENEAETEAEHGEGEQ